MWKGVLWTVAALGALAALAGAAVVYGGLYDVSATAPHTQPVYALLDTAMKKSVQRRARDIAVPPSLDAPERVRHGAACYRERCARCHGGPGVAAEAIGMAMQPLPGPLIDAARKWRAAELYWITRHGIKMSGMPAWSHHASDDELWALVAFLRRLPALTPAAYDELTARQQPCQGAEPPLSVGRDASQPAQWPVAKSAVAQGAAIGPAERGRLALRMYGCQGCHTIPGVNGPRSLVGPPLAGFASRRLIAGRLPHTQDNLVAWIRHPQHFDAQSAMPDLAVTQVHAEEMAAFLATLR